MVTGSAGTTGTLHILVVDDEDAILDFVELGLKYEGFELELARDGLEAHGGAIHSESAPGRGTTVTIELALPEATRQPARLAPDAAPVPERRQPVAPG